MKRSKLLISLLIFAGCGQASPASPSDAAPGDSSTDGPATDASPRDSGASDAAAPPGLTSPVAANQPCTVTVAASDGGVDVTSAVKSAIASAQGGVVCFPAGTYQVTNLTISGDVTLQGDAASMTASWIEGMVYFGSNQTYRNLKIGAAGTGAVQNQAGAANATFDHVHFRGGGTGGAQPIILLGDGGGVTNVTFTNCEIERNLDAPTSYGASYYNSGGYNDIRVSALPGSAYVGHVTFDHCHVGVSNGDTTIARNIGSPRAGIEVWTSPSAVAACAAMYQSSASAVLANCKGWEDVNLTNSIWEGADSFTIDLADYPLLDSSNTPLTSVAAVTTAGGGTRASGPATVSGNLIKGGGYANAAGADFPDAVAIEYPHDVQVVNNTVWGTPSQTIAVSNYGDPNGAGAVIRGNVIDFRPVTQNNADKLPLTVQGDVIDIAGGSGNITYGTTVSNNVVYVLDDTGGGRHTFYLEAATGNTITGNTVYDLSPTGTYGAYLYHADGNTITGNTFATASSSKDAVVDSGNGNTVTPNTFYTSCSVSSLNSASVAGCTLTP